MSSSAAQPSRPHTLLKVIEGGIWILLGLSLLANPSATTEAVVKLIGVFLIALGFYLIAEIFVGGLEVAWGWLAAGGIFAIISGLVTVNNSQAMAIVTAGVLAMLVASAVMVVGIMMIASGHGVFGTIAGILVILLGIVLLFNPVAMFAALPIVGGVLAIIAGVAVIVGGFRSRQEAPA